MLRIEPTVEGVDGTVVGSFVGGFASTFCFLTGTGALIVEGRGLVSFSGKYKTGLLLITAAPATVTWSLLDWEEEEENPDEALTGLTPARWSWVGKKNVDEGTADECVTEVGFAKNFG